MPYIKQEERPAFDRLIDPLACLVDSPGQLNYVITRLIHGLLARSSGHFIKVGYALLNEIVGVLACVKSEFERRVVAPYENQKIEENGDIGVLGEGD